MITEKEKYKKFIETESYHMPFDNKSMDRAALIAALLIIEEIKKKRFGIQIESSFEGVVLGKDIELFEKELLIKASELGIDRFFK